MKLNYLIKTSLAVLSLMTAGKAMAQYTIDGEAELIFNAGSHSFAPYYMSALNHGIISQSKGALLKAGVFRQMETDRRFSYSFGVQFVTGITSKTDYDRFIVDEGWVKNPQRPPAIWLQQLYGDIKYRCLFLSVGLKERGSILVDNTLSSGDLIESGNARPIAQVRAGFIDFRDIPFTNGWLQITGELAYGKFFQNNYLKNHSNTCNYNSNYNLGTFYHYKRCYLRTKPTKPFWATFGAQFCCLFGGDTYHFYQGKVSSVTKNRENLKAFWQAFFPQNNGIEGWYEGQHLGSWDFKFSYRIRSGAEFSAYYQNLWEDGSGMGKLNGFDGLWGIEYKAPTKGIVSGAVIEYIDFTNQSGPVNYNDHDYPGTNLTGYDITGVDSYYNNGFYNAYANYGFSIGTPFNKEPIYNLDGSLTFNNNRVRGFHAAVKGTITDEIDYRVMGGYRISYGTYSSPALTPRKDTSFMIEAIYSPARVQGLKVKGQFALDHGKLFGNLTGACVTVAYSGNFALNFKKSN